MVCEARNTAPYHVSAALDQSFSRVASGNPLRQPFQKQVRIVDQMSFLERRAIGAGPQRRTYRRFFHNHARTTATAEARARIAFRCLVAARFLAIR
jgi:hypothetical protein